MEKLEGKSSLFYCVCLHLLQITLFREELNQPQPHDESKWAGLQLWPYHGPWPSTQTIHVELSLNTHMFFLPSKRIVT